jgi:GAF domain-containing protein
MSDSANHRRQSGSPIELERALEQMLAARAETDVLRKAIATLAQNLRMDSLMDALLCCIREAIPYDWASVLLTEEGDQLFVAREAPRPADSRQVITLGTNENPFVERIVLARKDVFLPNTHAESTWRTTKYFGNPRCWIGIPLVMYDSVYGLLSLCAKQPRLFTQAHFRMSKLLAVPLVVAIHNARLYEWAQIYSEERKELLRRAEANPLPGEPAQLN